MVPVAVIIVVHANAYDRREVLNMEISPQKPTRSGRGRGLSSVRLVVCDASEASVAEVYVPGWVCDKSGRRVARSRTVATGDTPEAASQEWQGVSEQIRPKVLKLAAITYEIEPNVLAYISFPKGASGQAAQHKPDRTVLRGYQAAAGRSAAPQ